MKLSLKHDVAKLRRTLALWERKQLPFATSRALNDAAFAVRKHTVERAWPEAVDVKKRSFARSAFRVKTSSKVKLRAEVFARHGSEIFERQARGGIQIPYGSHLAIPTTNALTPTGRIRRAAVIRGNTRMFKARFGRTLGLWTRNRKGLQLMYHLVPRVRTPKSFRFYEDAERVAVKTFRRQIRKRLREALRTAR